jgi:hypothetical protein
MVNRDVFHIVSYTHLEEFTFREHARKPTIRNETGRFYNSWAAKSWYYVGPIITLHGRISALKYVDTSDNQVHPMIQTSLPNNETQFSKTTMPPFLQLELFSHGLKSMKVNFSIFPGQHNHQI